MPAKNVAQHAPRASGMSVDQGVQSPAPSAGEASHVQGGQDWYKVEKKRGRKVVLEEEDKTPAHMGATPVKKVGKEEVYRQRMP